jgi:hypothetical protein
MAKPASPDVPASPGGEEKPPSFWEKRVDAMDSLLCARAPDKYTVEKHRRAVEALPHAEYDRLTHYERWVVALKETAVRNGLLRQAEIEARVAEIERRRGGESP